jgi:hypothetical protein
MRQQWGYRKTTIEGNSVRLIQKSLPIQYQIAPESIKMYSYLCTLNVYVTIGNEIRRCQS